MDNLRSFYIFLEIAGTFAFAISGATAAKQKGLDAFGVFAIAFVVACGGGIIRDICIGSIPPAGLKNWYYLATALAATVLTIGFYPLVLRIYRPVLLFDAAGLSLFAVTGAQKTLLFGHNSQVAIILGITTAVGGGILRDILLNRVPVILEKEIYASAAFLAALIVAIGDYFDWLNPELVNITALMICFTFRIVALRNHWNLPTISFNKKLKINDTEK